jgi:hypothetical protein
VFPVRYELDLYILFRRNSIFKGLIQFTLFVMGKFNLKVEPSPGTDCVPGSRFHCT